MKFKEQEIRVQIPEGLNPREYAIVSALIGIGNQFETALAKNPLGIHKVEKPYYPIKRGAKFSELEFWIRDGRPQPTDYVA